jgi:hypothetical protein
MEKGASTALKPHWFQVTTAKAQVNGIADGKMPWPHDVYVCWKEMKVRIGDVPERRCFERSNSTEDYISSGSRTCDTCG